MHEIAPCSVDPYFIQRGNVEGLFNNLLALKPAREEETTVKTGDDQYIYFCPSVVARAKHYGETECFKLMVYTIIMSHIQIQRFAYPNL